MKTYSSLIDQPFPDDFPNETSYLNVIAEFPRYGQRGWKPFKNGHSGYFADGGSTENGIRTNANFLYISAFLASNHELTLDDETRLHWLEISKQSLNYLIEGHLTGLGRCKNGGQWGGHWQSAWWTTKLVLGAKFIWDAITKEQRKGVETVLEYEANRHLDRLVPSGIFGDTKAEENAWDNEILCVAYNHFSAHENKSKWHAKIIEFGLNTLSISADRSDYSTVDGKVVRDSVYTCNLHSDMSIENHGSCHFCYIASPLLSITWSFHSFLLSGNTPPEALFHHVQDLWEASKPLFLDNRFAYIGGKDWARYTYGLYFILPVLVMFQARFSDEDARLIETLRTKTLFAEHQQNNDGSFYGNRVTRNRFFGQSAKYETDCYVMCVLSYLLRKQLNPSPASTTLDVFRRKYTKLSSSNESRTAFTSFPKHFSSFSWSTITTDWPMAIFIPRGCDDMAEWAESNLVGKLRFFGRAEALGVRSSREMPDKKGVEIVGLTAYRDNSRELFEHKIKIEMLEDMMIVESLAVIKNDFWVKAFEPVCFNVANDYFNDFSRQYTFDHEQLAVKFDPNYQDEFQRKLPGKLRKVYKKGKEFLGKNAEYKYFKTNWVNVDNKLGIIKVFGSKPGFTLKSAHQRNTLAQCLHYDTLISGPAQTMPFKARKGQIMFHEKVILISGGVDATKTMAANLSEYSHHYY